jgi:hypothetical protein
MNYYKRLCEPYDAITVKPRVFVLSSHEIEMPNLVVARMVSLILFIFILDRYIAKKNISHLKAIS